MWHDSRKLCTAILIPQLLLVASCSAPSPNASVPFTETPTMVTAITREKAIELAMGWCLGPHLVLVGEPENVRARLMSLRQAIELTKTLGNANTSSRSLDSRVWLVEMDGLFQLQGGPLPTGTPIGWTGTAAPPHTPQPFRGSCTVILDADSGKMIVIYG